MAYQYTDYSGYGNETDEETRKRRAMMLAGLGTGQTFGDMAGQLVTNRLDQATNTINQAGQMLSNPQQMFEQRLAMQKQPDSANTEVSARTIKTYGDGSQEEILKKQIPAPVESAQPPPQPQMAMPRPPMPQQGPISPEMANRQMPPMNVPQPGPGVQVANAQRNLPAMQPAPQPAPMANTAFTPTVEREIQQPMTRDDMYHQMVISAKNEQDPAKRRNMYARLLADTNVNEGTKTLANRFIADDYFQQRNIADAERKIEQATETDLARYMREKRKEGSYVKAILFARLGLTDLAQKEQELLSPKLTTGSAVDSEGKRYTVDRNVAGEIVRAFDASGKQAGQETLASLSAAAMPTQSFLLPQSGGGLMQKTIIGPDGQPQVITGQVFTDPVTRDTYFQAGKNRYDTSGLSTPSQNVQNTYGAAQAGSAGKAAGEGLTVPPLSAFPGMAGQTVPPAPTTPVDPAVMARASRDLQALQTEINRIPATDPKREERLRILNSEVAKTQGLIGTNAPQVTQPLWKQRQNIELSTAQGKANIELNKEVAAAEAKVPAEARGKEQAKDIAKQGFADSTYPLLSSVREEISKSTGSAVGASVDSMARAIGASTKGAEAIAKLNVLAGPIKMNIPRFEGAQSDRDVQEYARQAGDFANPKLTVKERLAALDAMETLLKKYDKAGTNDWTFGRKQSEAGTTSSGNKYKKVQ